MKDACAQEPPGSAEELFFDARLRPHRSLSPRGFLLLMIVVAAVAFLAGLACFLIGAWPVVGFLGLDVALVCFAFKINYRHGRRYETLRLTRSDLTVARVDPWGARQTWHFQPAWLQVLIDDPPGHDCPLVLRSHGKSLPIGGFLAPVERADLATALRRALEQTRAPARSPCAVCAPKPA